MWLLGWLFLVLVVLIWVASSPFHWRSRNIPYLVPWPVFGNFYRVCNIGIEGLLNELYNTFPGKRYFGLHMYTRPVLFIKDPTLIYKILVSNFEHFSSHGIYTNQDRDPAGGGIVFIHGEQWKEIRGKMKPMFTPTKVKTMMTSIENSMPKLIEMLDNCVNNGEPVNARDALTRLTIDVTSQAIFGIQSDTFENEDSLFNHLAKGMENLAITLRSCVGFLSVRMYNLLQFTLYGGMYNVYMNGIMSKAIESRKSGLVERQDFIQAMMKLMETETSNDQGFFPDGTRVPKYDMNTVTAQGFFMFTAASETTALTMTFCMYEMAIRPDVQAKCRAEIYEVLKRDKCDRITADNAASLVYLTAVLQETLRLHPALNVYTRQCTKDFRLPDDEFTVEEGTFILMSPLNVHMDPRYHPDPEVFKPERFLIEEKYNMMSGTYFPFGLGPRICMGVNMAKIEMNIIVSRLLQHYEFSTSERLNVPMKHATYTIMTTPATAVWLDVRPLQG